MMPPFLQFLIRRFLVIPVSLLIITMILYGGVMLAPPEARATLYYPPSMRPDLSEEQMHQYQETIIDRSHLRDPFLVQYGRWIQALFQWVFLPPTLAVILFGIAWNIFGDGLNDVLEPPSQRNFAERAFWRWRKTKAQAPITTQQEILPVDRPKSTQIPPRKEPALQPMSAKKISTTDADPVLLAARDDMSHGELARALHNYNHLIQHNRLIEKILPDLAQLVKKFPRDPRVWQSLGDALARAGQPEHATQSYEQARKLNQ